MAYFLILDSDAPVGGAPLPEGSNIRIVTSSPNLAHIINVRYFVVADLHIIDASGLNFTHIRSTDLENRSVAGNPLTPAAFYAA
jgi:hypothetical protein